MRRGRLGRKQTPVERNGISIVNMSGQQLLFLKSYYLLSLFPSSPMKIHDANY